MDLGSIILACVAVYLVVGIATAVFFMQTPYQDDGWLLMVFLWPLYWIALLAR